MARFTTKALLLFMVSTSVYAGPNGFVYQGQIIKPNGEVLESSFVQFNIEILSPGVEKCLLYQESHILNLTNSNGLFSIVIGQGTRSGSDYEDISTLDQALSNYTGLVTPTTCENIGTYNPSADDSRRVKITFNDGSGPVTISQNQMIHSVPFAQQASSIDGVTSSELLRVNETGSYILNQSNLEQIFDNANYTELMNLINGTSTQYLASGSFTTPLDLNSQRIANLANPTAGNDATNKNYVDQNFGGSQLDLTGLADGQTLAWDALNSKWVVQTVSTADNTKLPLAGGTMTGSIDMGTNNISNATDISLSNDLSVGNDVSVTNNLSVGAGISVVGGIGVGTGVNSAGNINIQSGNELRLGDADDSHYIGFVAPAVITAGASFVWELPSADGTSGQLLQTNGTGVLSWVDPPVGTLVSVSNQGAGVGIFDNVNSGDVELRSLIPASTKVSLTLDGPNKEIDIDVNEANFDSSLIPNTTSGDIAATNVQAAINELDTEKVGSARSVLTGTGLTGGGDLSTDRTLSVDIPGLTDLGATADNTDTLMIYDSSSTALREITRTQLVLNETEVDNYVSDNGYAADSAVFKHDGSVAMTGDIDVNNNDILNLSLGSAAAPSLSFNVDPNTGLFSPAPDSLSLSTAGNEVLTINSSGNVGIGTGIPSGKLDIEGGDVFIGTGTLTNTSANEDLSLTGNLEVDGVIYGNGSGLTNVAASPAGGSTQLQFNNSGSMAGASDLTYSSLSGVPYLNIGGASTSNAEDKLIIKNAIYPHSWIRVYSTASGYTALGHSNGNTRIVNNQTGSIMFGDNSTRDILSVDTSPNEVIVGKAVDTSTFSTASQASSSPLKLKGSYWTGATTVEHNFSLQNVASTTVNEEGRLAIQWDSAELMSLTDEGSLGIGTISPSGKLDIEGGDVFIGTGTLTNASASEDLSVTGNLEVDGVIYGDGSGLTGISASPAGANTQIQFNDSGTMAGDSSLLWNKTQKILKVNSGYTGTVAGLGLENLVIGDGTNYWRMYSTNTPSNTLTIGNCSNSACSATSPLLSVVPTGNVGIGTTSPGRKLNVHGGVIQVSSSTSGSSAGAGLQLSMSSDAASITNMQNDILTFGTNGTEKVRISNTGSVGIGTNNPSGKLDIEGGDVFLGTGTLTNGTANVDMNVSGNLEVDGVIYGNGSGLTGIASTPAGSNKEIQFNNSGSLGATNSFVYDSAFNYLGIGTGSPNYPIHVVRNINGNASIVIENPNTGTSARSQTNLQAAGSVLYMGAAANTHTGTGLYQAGSGFMEHTSGGGLSIGATHSAGDIRFYAGGSAAGNQRMTITDSGNVGIGSAIPATTLDVVGDIQYTGTITDVSDKRLKENIEPLNDALRAISSINTYSYTMKDDPEQRVEFGVMAQELQEVLPELVSHIDTEKKYLGVNYMGLLPWILKSVQELDHKVENKCQASKEDFKGVDRRLASLEEQNQQLKDEVQNLRDNQEKMQKQIEFLMKNIKINP